MNWPVIGLFSPLMIFWLKLIPVTESKEKRGENSVFWFLGRTVRADIFGRIDLGSKKSSQIAAFVGKIKHKESSLTLHHYCQLIIQLACLT